MLCPLIFKYFVPDKLLCAYEKYTLEIGSHLYVIKGNQSLVCGLLVNTMRTTHKSVLIYQHFCHNLILCTCTIMHSCYICTYIVCVSGSSIWMTLHVRYSVYECFLKSNSLNWDIKSLQKLLSLC